MAQDRSEEVRAALRQAQVRRGASGDVRGVGSFEQELEAHQRGYRELLEARPSPPRMHLGTGEVVLAAESTFWASLMDADPATVHHRTNYKLPATPHHPEQTMWDFLQTYGNWRHKAPFVRHFAGIGMPAAEELARRYPDTMGVFLKELREENRSREYVYPRLQEQYQRALSTGVISSEKTPEGWWVINPVPQDFERRPGESYRGSARGQWMNEQEKRIEAFRPLTDDEMAEVVQRMLEVDSAEAMAVFQAEHPGIAVPVEVVPALTRFILFMRGIGGAGKAVQGAARNLQRLGMDTGAVARASRVLSPAAGMIQMGGAEVASQALRGEFRPDDVALVLISAHAGGILGQKLRERLLRPFLKNLPEGKLASLADLEAAGASKLYQRIVGGASGMTPILTMEAAFKLRDWAEHKAVESEKDETRLGEGEGFWRSLYRLMWTGLTAFAAHSGQRSRKNILKDLPPEVMEALKAAEQIMETARKELRTKAPEPGAKLPEKVKPPPEPPEKPGFDPGLADLRPGALPSIGEPPPARPLPSSKTAPTTGFLRGAPVSSGDAIGVVKYARPEFAELRPVEMMEVIRWFREATGRVPKVRPMRGGLRGLMRPKGEGFIELNAELMKNPREAAQVLMHEIGHWIDYLPDHYIQRGNILGRLKSLRNFLGEQKYAKPIMEELKGLTQWWKPFDEAAVPPSYRKYRYSSVELYADAISVLLNSPGDLQARAPKFYRELFRHLDTKPMVLDAYLSIQDMMQGKRADLVSLRRKSLSEMFETGIQKRLGNQQEIEEGKQSTTEWIKQYILDRGFPVLDLQKGQNVPDHLLWRYIGEEFNYAENRNHIFMNDVAVKIDHPLQVLKLNQGHLGEYLFHRRIVRGDRMDKWNPDAWDSKSSAEALRQMRKELGPERYQALERAGFEFDQLVFGSIRNLYDQSGLTPEMMNTARKGLGTYATFSIQDHIWGRIGATFQKQIGTLKEGENPYYATVLKTIAINRLAELQRAKLALDEYMTSSYPEHWVDRTSKDPRVRGTPTPKEGRGIVSMLKNGRMKHYETDPYIAKVFHHSDVAGLNKIAAIHQWTKGFHNLFVTWNLFFVPRNMVRDLWRTYKGLASMKDMPDAKKITLREIVRTWFSKETRRAAWERAMERPFTELEREMIEAKALDVPFVDYNPMQPEAFAPHERALLRRGGYQTKRQKIAELLEKVLLLPFGTRRANVYFEAAGKMTGYQVMKSHGLQGPELAYRVRNHVGTPNFARRGLASNASNALWMYSNVRFQGWRSDMGIATQPNSRAGYWFKTLITEVMPSVAAWGMVHGKIPGMPEEVTEIARLIPDYFYRNYYVIPFGTRVADDGQVHARFFSIPKDDTGRLISSLLFTALDEEGDLPEAIKAVFKVASGEAPSFAPPIMVATKGIQYISGGEPRDNWRDTNIIRPSSRDAGWPYPFYDMFNWAVNQLGVISAFGRVARDGLPETTTEVVLYPATVLSRPFLRTSNRGLIDRQYAEIQDKDEIGARIRKKLGIDSARLRQERYRLNALGPERLDKAQQRRQAQLNRYYTLLSGIIKAIRAAQAHGDADMEERAYAEAKKLTEKTLERLKAIAE